jgi:hypothetical protein
MVWVYCSGTGGKFGRWCARVGCRFLWHEASLERRLRPCLCQRGLWYTPGLIRTQRKKSSWRYCQWASAGCLWMTPTDQWSVSHDDSFCVIASTFCTSCPTANTCKGNVTDMSLQVSDNLGYGPATIPRLCLSPPGTCSHSRCGTGSSLCFEVKPSEIIAMGKRFT